MYDVEFESMTDRSVQNMTTSVQKTHLEMHFMKLGASYHSYSFVDLSRYLFTPAPIGFPWISKLRNTPAGPNSIVPYATVQVPQM